jgi:hypothetical protein
MNGRVTLAVEGGEEREASIGKASGKYEIIIKRTILICKTL